MRNFPKRYGQGSWAMITGASDGIGKEIAIRFSKLGFKIILIARNKSKLEQVAKDLSTDSHIIVADFGNSLKEGFFDRIIDEIGDRDVSILVNNVGVDMFGYFACVRDEEIMQILKVNCLPITMLTKRMIPQLLPRKHKSAVINVTSLAGEFPTALFNVYTASKAYGDFLTQTISYEYPQLDIISVKPSEVSTNMIYNRQPDLLTITTKECVDGILNDLSRTNSSNGHWKHQLQSALYKRVPMWFFNWVLIRFIAPGWIKERSEGKKNQ